MRKTAVVLLLGVFLLSGCATMRGAGEDLENAGEWIQDNVFNQRQEDTREHPITDSEVKMTQLDERDSVSIP